MEIPTKTQIKQLAELTNGACISIYMPTHRKGAETQQNAIRFKNLLSKAEGQLRQLGFRSTHLETWLQPAKELLADNDFWQHQDVGLAFFRSSEALQFYRLPLHLDELIVVGTRFHIKPLLSLLQADGQFHILALNLSHVRLLHANRYSASEIDLGGVPRSLEEALKYDHPEKQLQFHTRAGQAKGGRAAVFHGQGKGAGIDDTERKKNILRFFQQLDNGINKLLADHNAPLVLAGIEYLIPLYEAASSYPRLVRQAVVHNPEEIGDEELCREAWEVMEPYFRKGEKRAVEKYEELKGSAMTSNDVQKVVKESHDKRVESLFVKTGQQVWGVFDEQSRELVVHQEIEVGDEDLFDLAAVQTFVNGGSVYVMEAELMPDGEDVAAIYRF